MFVAIGAVTLTGLCFGSDDRGGELPSLKLRMSGVLSNAASAASAAATAANAAAEAARAAAVAATSAVEAINAILPASQRAALPERLAPTPAAVQTVIAPTAGAKTEPKIPVPEIAASVASASVSPSETSVLRFELPSEQSLAALVGTVELPVAVSDYTNFGARIGGEQLLDTPGASGDPETSLDEAIGAGRGFSRDTLAAEERVKQAKAQSGQSLANLLPSLSMRKNGGRETSSPSAATDAAGNVIPKETHHRTDSVWTFRQALLDMPSMLDYRRRGVIESARDDSRKASDGDAYLASVNAYLSLISTRLLADMARDFEQKLGELLVYVDKRAAAGAASSADMARVRARNKAAASSRLEQESAHAAAGVEFVRLTNLAPKIVRLPDLAELGAKALPASADQAIEIAMEHNPDISSLVFEARAADMDRSVARSRFLPRLDLELTDNKSVHAQGNPNPDGQHDKRAMLVASWSLLSGGGDVQYGKERSARHLELKYKLDDQRRRVVQSLMAQYATLWSTRERLSTGYQELKAITTAAEAMSARMLSGNQSLLDLLDTYERHYQARVRLVNMHIQEMNSVAQIVRLVQGVPTRDGKMLSATAAARGVAAPMVAAASTQSVVMNAAFVPGARTELTVPAELLAPQASGASVDRLSGSHVGEK